MCVSVWVALPVALCIDWTWTAPLTWLALSSVTVIIRKWEQKAQTAIQEARTKDSGATVYHSMPGVEALSATTLAITANVMYYAPIFVTTTITIDQLACVVTVAVRRASSCGWVSTTPIPIGSQRALSLMPERCWSIRPA
jgi:hypothetical protein